MVTLHGHSVAEATKLPERTLRDVAHRLLDDAQVRIVWTMYRTDSEADPAHLMSLALEPGLSRTPHEAPESAPLARDPLGLRRAVGAPHVQRQLDRSEAERASLRQRHRALDERALEERAVLAAQVLE